MGAAMLESLGLPLSAAELHPRVEAFEVRKASHLRVWNKYNRQLLHPRSDIAWLHNTADTQQPSLKLGLCLLPGLGLLGLRDLGLRDLGVRLDHRHRSFLRLGFRLRLLSLRARLPVDHRLVRSFVRLDLRLCAPCCGTELAGTTEAPAPCATASINRGKT